MNVGNSFKTATEGEISKKNNFKNFQGFNLKETHKQYYEQ
jgi:hypothetical protein